MNDDKLSSKWIPAIVNGASSPMEVAECTGCSDHWSTHDTKKKKHKTFEKARFHLK